MVVIVTASEGKPPSTNSPDRFIGDAGFTVMNIAPWDGGVSFGVRIEWDERIGLWTDITVFDRTEPIYQPPSKFADD